MEELTNTNSGQVTAVEWSPSEWFRVLQERIEHILESHSLTADSVSVHLPEDELGLSAWLRLGLYVEQVRGPETEIANVVIGARWGRTENSADMVDILLSRSRLESEADRTQSLGQLALLDLCVETTEAAVFNL